MGKKIYGKKLLELIPKLDYMREVVFGCGGGEPVRTVSTKGMCDFIMEIRDTIQEECSEDYRMVFRNKAWEEERKKRSEANQIQRYICPECGTEMKESPIDAEVVRVAPDWEGRINLCCPRCKFSIMKNHYNFLHDLGKYGVAKLPPKEKNKGKREMSVPEMIFHAKNGDETPEDAYMPEYAAEKPPLGCAPSYVYISARICELCEAIKRYSTETGKHNKIALWCKEIMLLNEMDRNLRYDEKCKVWKEDKDGNLQEMP